MLVSIAKGSAYIKVKHHNSTSNINNKFNYNYNNKFNKHLHYLDNSNMRNKQLDSVTTDDLQRSAKATNESNDYIVNLNKMHEFDLYSLHNYTIRLMCQTWIPPHDCIMDLFKKEVDGDSQYVEVLCINVTRSYKLIKHLINDQKYTFKPVLLYSKGDINYYTAYVSRYIIHKQVYSNYYNTHKEMSFRPGHNFEDRIKVAKGASSFINNNKAPVITLDYRILECGEHQQLKPKITVEYNMSSKYTIVSSYTTQIEPLD